MSDVTNSEPVAETPATTEAAPEVTTEAKVDGVIENPEVVPTPAEPVISEGSVEPSTPTEHASDAPAEAEAPAGDTPAA